MRFFWIYSGCAFSHISINLHSVRSLGLIRPATAVDLWALRRRPQRRIFLYTEAMLAHSYRPFVVSVRSMLGPLGNDLVTLVLRNHSVYGFIQAHKRPYAPEIDLSYLASFNNRDRTISDGDIWFKLIESLIERAGLARIERIFAAVAQRREDMSEVLKQLGFQPYAQQQVWTLTEPAVEAGSSLVALRRQHRRDVWLIHQLYERVTPRYIQQAEFRRSESWRLPRPRRRIGWRERGWVLGDDQALLMYVHVLTGPRGHVLRLLCDPAVRQHVAAMLRYVLSQITEPRTVFAVIRGYQLELGNALSEVGFRLRGEQTLFVKHLVVPRQLPQAETGLEPVPQLPSVPY
jgi:hypothetical protein